MIFIKIIIDKENKVPIYIQIKKQIKELIHKGNLKVGQKLPTERELSEQLKISRNTVSTSYNDLELDGILKSYQGKGTFVAEDAHPWKEQNIKDRIIKFVELGLEEALETGMDTDEFLQIVTQSVLQKKEMMNTMIAVYIECNIEQAKMFSQQLSKSTHMKVMPLTIHEIENMNKDTNALIENAQLVVTTFNHVVEIKTILKNYDKRVLGVAINPDLNNIVKIARCPMETKFGMICISEQFKFKVKGALEKAGLENINIKYTNTINENELEKFLEQRDVFIVSPGRVKDVEKLNKENKEIIKFTYSLEDGSVKALKSKMVEFNE